MMPTDNTPVQTQPGYLIRRLHQIAVAIFLQETEQFGVTSVQYAALQSICNQPGLDQRTLAASLGLDTSTLAGVVDRLESRGWCARTLAPHDRRVRLLHPTAEGQALVSHIVPHMLQAQSRILEPLSPNQQRDFLKMLHRLVQGNNDHSRAPRAASES
jgi:MarR family transcriptional regulator, lower aerobic nicotinate degradation pathway regulator